MNGILQDRPGSGSRPIETLTSSRAVTASYALVAETIKDGSGLTVETASYALVAKSVEASSSLVVETASYAREAGKVGSGTTGSSNQPVFWSNGTPVVADEIPTSKTGSWDNAASWLGDNSASIGFTASTLTVTASYGKATEFSASWNPSSSNQNINITIPVSASHVGAVAVENFEEYTASVSGVYVPIAGGQISGNLVVAGNLVVSGTISGIETPESVSYATSASEAIHAVSASNVVSASYASSSTTASYALIAESVKEGGSLVVETASYAFEAANAVTASYALVAETLQNGVVEISGSAEVDDSNVPFL